MKENRAYGNIEVYSPDNELMFRANEDKLKFYINKNLVEQIGDNKYKLLFEPKGKGHFDRNKILLEPRENKCVCCGDEDILMLTRHHVVPSRFRKHFPDYIKGNNHRYIVFLCRDCHNEYGTFENELNDVLAARFDVMTIKECAKKIVYEKKIITGIADSILYKDGIPEDRIEALKKHFVEKTGMEPTEQNLKKVHKQKYEPPNLDYNFGYLVVNMVENIYDFQQEWLEHFVSSMKPKYLPQDLSILLKRDA